MTISSIHQLEKTIGDMLLKQTELKRSRIVNGLSIRGADLSKFITDNVSLSYDVSDVALIFEISAMNEDSINITEAEDDSIREDACFEVSLTCYGNESLLKMKQLKARLESDKVRYDLSEEGVYFIDASSIIQINDFLNETIYPRTSMTFRIACELQVSLVDDFNEIEAKPDIAIETALKDCC